jgi:hypothetical protein
MKEVTTAAQHASQDRGWRGRPSSPSSMSNSRQEEVGIMDCTPPTSSHSDARESSHNVDTLFSSLVLKRRYDPSSPSISGSSYNLRLFEAIEQVSSRMNSTTLRQTTIDPRQSPNEQNLFLFVRVSGARQQQTE